MASELSTYLADLILNWLDGDAMPTAPADLYLALWDGDPGPTGATGTEVTTDIAAARLAVTWGAVAGRQMLNSAVVDFGLADGPADITHAALFDAAVAGNMVTYTPLDNERNVLTGDPVVIPIGDAGINFN